MQKDVEPCKGGSDFLYGPYDSSPARISLLAEMGLMRGGLEGPCVSSEALSRVREGLQPPLPSKLATLESSTDERLSGARLKSQTKTKKKLGDVTTSL